MPNFGIVYCRNPPSLLLVWLIGLFALESQTSSQYGYIDQYPLEKLFRDAKLYQIYEGTSEVQRLILGRHVLSGYEPAMDKIPKWYNEKPPDF